MMGISNALYGGVEIAHARGTDPRDTWLDVIGPPRKLSLADLGLAKLPNYGESLDKHPVDAGRLRSVITRVTDLCGWSRRNGRALGLAAHRIRDVPYRIHTDLVESTEPPSGVGEPGVPPVGAALANALFALTEKRLREIPLAKALKI